MKLVADSRQPDDLDVARRLQHATKDVSTVRGYKSCGGLRLSVLPDKTAETICLGRMKAHFGLINETDGAQTQKQRDTDRHIGLQSIALGNPECKIGAARV